MSTSLTDNATIVPDFKKKLLPVFAGKIFPACSLLLIMILYARKLQYDAYGQYQAMWLYNSIAGAITSFGVSSALLGTPLQQWLAFVRSNKQRIALLYLGGTLLVLLLLFLSDSYFDPNTRLLLLLFIVVQNSCSFLDSLLIKKNQLSLYVSINFVYTFLLVAVHLYFYLNSFSMQGLLWTLLVVSLLKCLGYWISATTIVPAATKELTVSVGPTWWYLGLNEVAGVVARWLDKLFLLYLLTPAEFAVFFNGSFEIPLFAILLSTIENVLLTQISGDPTNAVGARKTFRDSFKLMSMIAFPLFFYFLVMHKELFAFVFHHKYDASIPVFLVSIAVIPVRITHYGVLLQSYGKSYLIALGANLDILLSFLLMILLYPWLGTPGVALAIVLSTYAQALFYIWQSAKLCGCSIGQLVPIGLLFQRLFLFGLLYGTCWWFKSALNETMALSVVSLLTAGLIGGNLWRYFQPRRLAA